MTAGSGDWARAMLKSVRAAVQALPSEDEVQDGVEAIDALVGFLQQLRAQLLAQPTARRREDAEKAIVVLESFLVAHRGGVLLGRAVRRPVSKGGSDVSALRRELQAMPLDEVRARLLDQSRTSQKDLRALARELRLRVDSKLPHADLADAIFKRGFANPRGYDSLKGVSHVRDDHERGKTSGRIPMQPSSMEAGPKTVAALAFARALEIVVARHGSASLAEWIHGVRADIQRGGDPSVDVNVGVLLKEVAASLPAGFAPLQVSDDLRNALRKALAGRAPDVIREAAQFLERAIGGRAQTFIDTWGEVPP